MSEETVQARDRDNSWRVFGVLTGVVIVLMVLGYFGVWNLVGSDNWSTFAEVYGALVGTFFAGLAFVGLIVTIHLQRRELRETREELAKTATAQVESQKAHEAHVKVAQQSARLSAATALLNHYQAQIPDLEYKAQPGVGGGSKVLERLTEVRREVDALEVEIQELRDELKNFVRYVEGRFSDTPEGIRGTVKVSNPDR